MYLKGERIAMRFEIQKLGEARFIVDKERNLMFYPTSTTATWDEANKLALTSKAGGLTGWRIPTLKELESLINRDRANPASDMPDVRARRVCSRDVFIGNPNAVWVVNFYDGSVLTAGKQDTYFILFVKSLDEVNLQPLKNLVTNTVAIEIESIELDLPKENTDETEAGNLN